jgi:hypothetical protein
LALQFVIWVEQIRAMHPLALFAFWQLRSQVWFIWLQDAGTTLQPSCAMDFPGLLARLKEATAANKAALNMVIPLRQLPSHHMLSSDLSRVPPIPTTSYLGRMH